MTNSLICLFEDENKNCVKWCYPPRLAKNLTLVRSAAPWSVPPHCAGYSEVDTPRHVLLRCPVLAGRRLRRLGTIYPDVTVARDDGVVASFASGYRVQLSRIGYVP